MAQSADVRLTADELNAKTEKTAILIRCTQESNYNHYYNPTGRGALGQNSVVYWVPAGNGEFYITKGDGENDYLQKQNITTFGTQATAAKFHAVKPTGSGEGVSLFAGANCYESEATGGEYWVRLALTDNEKWFNFNGNTYDTGTGVWTVQNVYTVAGEGDAFAIKNQLTAAELMAKTEPTYIAMKNLSRRNPDWYAGTSSSALITDANIFVWEPTDGGFRLKNLEGQYIQSGNENVNISFGTVDNAAVFTAVKPYVGGSETAAMDHDNDSNPYITSDQDENLVRFVNEKGVWINVQNSDGTPGTPKYNKGKGGWTIHYVYELTLTDTYEASITDAGYATFYVPANVEIPEGVKAYYITSEGIKTNSVSLTEITGVIPANTAVVLEGEEGDYTFNVSDAYAAAVSGNLLKGTPISTNITEEAYVLGNKDGVGLYKAITKDVSTSGGTKKVFLNNANKAYLPVSAVPATAQTSNGFRFGEGTTGIDEITENGEQSTVIYDLTGRRVEEITAPGIYIVGGKKVLVK